ncbi:hypothetical protein BU14_0615s0011 [Porphyra umbilicalis]|uniref:Uncharacterized protein n=1 Tax=Porphyra umbilicalis TaxID=2786 RepID=A0A1X6NQX8_PORUM|nr:hypothetical protein BU14_0615s0011 [Porphyra umbilicalis]|eukprot:OSX71021.1 hypothetical protein BU14_0615s0011 [Porphyra umbilicalis]
MGKRAPGGAGGRASCGTLECRSNHGGERWIAPLNWHRRPNQLVFSGAPAAATADEADGGGSCPSPARRRAALASRRHVPRLQFLSRVRRRRHRPAATAASLGCPLHERWRAFEGGGGGGACFPPLALRPPATAGAWGHPRLQAEPSWQTRRHSGRGSRRRAWRSVRPPHGAAAARPPTASATHARRPASAAAGARRRVAVFLDPRRPLHCLASALTGGCITAGVVCAVHRGLRGPRPYQPARVRAPVIPTLSAAPLPSDVRSVHPSTPFCVFRSPPRPEGIHPPGSRPTPP